METLRKNKFFTAFCISVGILFLILCGGIVFLKIKCGSLKEGIEYTSKYFMSDIGQVFYFTLTKNPYVGNFKSMYLPLNMLLLMPFALICKGNSAFYQLINVSEENWYEEILSYNAEILHTWQFWVAALSFFALFITLDGILLYRLRKWNSRRDFIFGYVAVVLSGVFAFGVFRGTTAFQCLTFVLLFLNFYNSDKKVLKEIALLCLAVAGVMKLYPLLFGVLLLKKRRIFDSVRVAIYFAALAILPFFIYEAPIATMKSFLKCLLNFSSDSSRLRDLSNLSVYNLVDCFFGIFKVERTPWLNVICLTATLIVFGVCVTLAFISKNNFTTMFAITSGLALIPTVSYNYVLIFMSIPLVYLFDEWNIMQKKRKILWLIYYVMWSLLPLVALRIYVINSTLTLALLIVEFVLCIKTAKARQFNEILENTEDAI